MIYEYLKRDKAELVYNDFINNNLNLDNLNAFYKNMRKALIEFHEKYKVLLEKRKYYLYDLNMALEIYSYYDINEYGYACLSNYDFWRYICVKVVPDIIRERHGINPEYYFKKNVRMYIPTLWWYINMTWQGSLEQTKIVLEKHNTDTIQSLVERPGRQGVFLETYRKIIEYYDKLDQRDRVVDGQKKYYLLRRIMVLHTAKCLLFDPNILGADNYVRMLFENVGIKFNESGSSYEYIRRN